MSRLIRPFTRFKWISKALKKAGYDYFMMKEIYEQPRAIYDTFRGRLLPEQGMIKMSGLEEYADKFRNADRIIMTACGTSWHSALVAEYLFEEYARIPVEVEYGSEFRYRNPDHPQERYRHCHFSKW